MIKILYFASLKDKLNQAEEQLDFTGTITMLMQQLASRGDRWATAFADDQSVLSAVNQEMAKAETTVTDGDEVGFFPPVTGG